MVYKLKIETLSGKGKAAFDKDGKTEEVYNGKGEEESIPLYGIEESTEEHNIKITGSKDGNLLDEQKFIVFSEVKYEFSSPITKHKDTNAPCKHCDAQIHLGAAYGTRLHAHNEDLDITTDPDPCDHVSFHSGCGHCIGYCFRCCMKHICGGNQDDYVFWDFEKEKWTSVEENHKKWLDDGSAKKHSETKGKPISIFQNPFYKTAYEKLLEKKRFIGGIWIDGSGIHTDIIYGIRLNRADGTVDGKGIVVSWNPTTAQNELEKELAEYKRIYPEK